MRNLFKRKKKQDGVLSFPFYLLFSHHLVLDRLITYNNISYNEALAYVLNRGFAEYAHELLDSKPATAEQKEERKEREPEQPLFKAPSMPDQDQRKKRPVQFDNQMQERPCVRPGYIRCSNRKTKGSQYLYMNTDDSAKFTKDGYRFYKITKSEKGEVYLALFRSEEKDTHAISRYMMYEGEVLEMRFHEMRYFSPIAVLRDALGIEEEKADIRFVVCEGQGCLLLRLFYDKDIINQPINN